MISDRFGGIIADDQVFGKLEMKPTRRSYLLFFLFVLMTAATIIPGCYSFRSTSFDEAVQSFYVANFKLIASNAPPTITQTFTEALKDKISRESRLKFTDEDPHIEFNGSVQGFNVTAVAPQPGERTAFNRLTITVSVDYTNHLNPKDKWTKSFSHFEDFAAGENLSAVQEDLINVIFNQILEDVFNQAFNNW